VSALSFAQVDRLTGFRLGTFDIACPECGPDRRDPRNRTRKVLRIYRRKPDFAGFKCARCGIEGSVNNAQPMAGGVARAQRLTREATTVPVPDAADRRAIALALWRRRQPVERTPAELYLRQVRCYGGPIPATLGYLPPHHKHAPALIAAFTLATEIEPDVVAVDDDAAVVGVHLTRLQADGRGKTGNPAKIMLGRSIGTPIVLAPPNDLLGLVIAEGVETGLSLAEATGCGVWAVGGASRMPALAKAVPSYIDTVVIAAEADDGSRHAYALADRLRERSIHVEVRFLGLETRTA
jgi:hypothetical protein